MLETHPAPRVVRFESFEVDVRTGELRKHGHRIRLQDQPFRVLQILLEQPGEVVTREDLQRQIWPSDTFVDFDRGLNNTVKRLREALGDSADTPRYVETLARRGYRFIAPVKGAPHVEQAETESAPAIVPQPVSLVAWRRLWKIVCTVAAGLVLFVGVGLNIGAVRELSIPAAIRSIAGGVAVAGVEPSQPVDPKAREAFLEGRFHADQAYEAVLFKSGSMEKSDEEFAKGISCLEQAIQEDPSYVPAYLELAASILGEPPHPDLAPKAQDALIQALAREETNPAVHLLMADFLGFGRGWDDPENHYKRAIQLAPNSAKGHEAHAEYLDDLGRFEEGMKEHEEAQRLDPNRDYISRSPLTPLSVRLKRTRRFMLINAPDGYDLWWLGEMEFESAQYLEALEHWTELARDYGWNEEADAWEQAYANGGSQALIREVVKVFDGIARARYFPRDLIIDAHRLAGDRAGALAWLATASKECNPTWGLAFGAPCVTRHLRSDLRWDPYRSDPRFQAIARSVGLPP